MTTSIRSEAEKKQIKWVTEHMFSGQRNWKRRKIRIRCIIDNDENGI